MNIYVKFRCGFCHNDNEEEVGLSGFYPLGGTVTCSTCGQRSCVSLPRNYDIEKSHDDDVDHNLRNRYLRKQGHREFFAEEARKLMRHSGKMFHDYKIGIGQLELF